MHTIEQIFINGEFVTPHGTEWFDLYNPATARVIGQVRLADEVDAERAIAAAKAAFPAWSQTTKQERIAALKRMHVAVAARHDDLLDAIVEEYGAPASRSAWMASYPAEVIAQAIEALEAFAFVTPAGAATVQMTPLGVAGLITPWNSDAGFICGKLAAALAQAVAAVKSGDPRDSVTEIGPMVSEKQWLRVQGYIRKGIEEGARLLAGGEGRPDGTRDGWFVRPTLFADVNNRMTIARDEIFGPVLCVIPYQDEAEAIAIANDTEYGLSAMVLGGDADRARRVAQQIVSGRVLVNTLAHEPKAPFGGFKHSGVGREMGEWGIRAFMEPRSVLG